MLHGKRQSDFSTQVFLFLKKYILNNKANSVGSCRVTESSVFWIRLQKIGKLTKENLWAMLQGVCVRERVGAFGTLKS